MVRMVLALLTCALAGIAPVDAQSRLGIKGSVQRATQQLSAPGLPIATDYMSGFQAGLMLDVPLSTHLSIRPQLLYSTKGFELATSQFGIAGTVKTTINYLEVPVQLVYAFGLGAGNVVAGAGPYVAYALNGKGVTTLNGQTETRSIDLGEATARKRFDAGLALSVGYEAKAGVGISAYYAPGLATLTNTLNSLNVDVRNTAFGVSLGYFFRRKD